MTAQEMNSGEEKTQGVTPSGKTIVSGMVWRFAEKITAQGVSFIVSIILARILMPDDYGIVALVNVFIAIAEVFVTSGLGTALIQKKDATLLDFSTLFWCNLILSGIIYLIVFLAAPLIAAYYDIPLLTPVLRVVAIRIPINAVNSIQNAYVSRHMDFKKFFFATIIGTVISAIVGIVMAYRGFGVWALVAQVLINTTIDTFVLFVTIRWKPSLVFSMEAAKPLIGFGWKILATDLIGTVFNHLNAFIIGKRYGSSDLAYYSQGRKYPELINNNIEATMSAVLFPAMSLSTDIEDIKAIRRKSLKMMEFVLFPIMFGLFVIADRLIVVLLTEKWIPAVPFVRIACISSVLSILGTTLIQEIKAIGRSDITLKLEFIKKSIYIIVILIAVRFGVLAIAWTSVVFQIVAFCINVYPVRKYIGFSFRDHLCDAVPPLLMALTMAVIVYLVGGLISNDTLCLVVQIATGGSVYLAASILSKNEEFYYLLRLILSKIGRVKR